MNPRNVSVETARAWLATGDVRMIDVRDADEFRRTHIDGAENLPLSHFDAMRVLSSGDVRMILVCRTGRRSEAATQQMLDAGATEVFNLEGGLAAWEAAGGPLVHDRKAPIGIQRQVQITVGAMILTGTVLGVAISPWYLLISGFAGAGLLVAGITDTCAMAAMLARMPWNRRSSALPATPVQAAE